MAATASVKRPEKRMLQNCHGQVFGESWYAYSQKRKESVHCAGGL
jgi:hypothetical protein